MKSRLSGVVAYACNSTWEVEPAGYLFKANLGYRDFQKKRKLLSLGMVGDNSQGKRERKKTFENPLGNRRVLI